jgi:hypothetical protein
LVEVKIPTLAERQKRHLDQLEARIAKREREKRSQEIANGERPK